MKRITAALSLALLVSPIGLPASAADPDITATPGFNETFAGSTNPGANVDYHNDLVNGGQCNGVDDPQYACQSWLIQTDALLDFTDEDTANDIYETVLDITLTPTVAGSDYDIALFKSNDSGARRGEPLATSGNFWFPERTVLPFGIVGAPTEDVSLPMKIDEERENVQYFVLDVIFYSAAGGYALDVSF